MNKLSVAVLDSGIYRHIDFDNRIVGFHDSVSHKNYAYDDCGHGTHVSGIIGGSGYASRGRFKGIAPMVNLVGVKVLDSTGNGCIDDVVDGVFWIIKNKEKYNIKVANISFGSTNFDNPKDAKTLENTIEKMWNNNIIVVAAAGNDGPKPHSVAAPGTNRKIITVGAYDDRIFRSGRGPTSECIVKPELVVAGTNIIACSNIRNGYSSKSGTSMATPIVSGAIARVLSQKELTPKEIKIRIKKCCNKINIPANQQGWGMLDLVKFITCG